MSRAMSEPRLAGYVVANTELGDFLGSRRVMPPDGVLFAYTADPGSALFFSRRRKAQRVVDEIDRPEVVVCELYDCGEQWVVLPLDSGEAAAPGL